MTPSPQYPDYQTTQYQQPQEQTPPQYQYGQSTYSPQGQQPITPTPSPQFPILAPSSQPIAHEKALSTIRILGIAGGIFLFIAFLVDMVWASLLTSLIEPSSSDIETLVGAQLMTTVWSTTICALMGSLFGIIGGIMVRKRKSVGKWLLLFGFILGLMVPIPLLALGGMDPIIMAFIIYLWGFPMAMACIGALLLFVAWFKANKLKI